MINLAQRVTRGRGRQIKYLISGGAAAAVEYGVFILMIYGLSTPLWVSQGTSFLNGACVAFTLQALWSFGDIEGKRFDRKRQFSLYMLLAVINTLVTSVVVGPLVVAGLAPWIAKMALMVAVVVWNYLLLSRVIFAKKV